MLEGHHTWNELSTALNETITPHLVARGFSFEDTPEDDPIYQLGDMPVSRRFYRPSQLGFDYFDFRFLQYSGQNKALGVGIEMGVHVEAMEDLEYEVAASFMNPHRIGKRLSHVFLIKDDLEILRHAEEAGDIAERLMEIIDAEGEAFWSEHRTLASIEQYFESLPERERHSPKGAPYVSRPLMLIACLKQDRHLFDRIVREYRRYITMEIYRIPFDHMVKELNKKFSQPSEESRGWFRFLDRLSFRRRLED